MEGGVFALGNFDGVHRGHQAVVRETIKKAREIKASAKVLTFEPHPRSFFQPNLPPFRLTPPEVKERLLKALGIDQIVTLTFDANLAGMSAQEFVENLLIQKLKVQHIVAGNDFAFGRNRSGNMAKMEAWLAPHGIGVTEVGEMGEDGEVFSSSRARELLLEGEVEAAAKILGRPWSIEGTVVKGKGIGGKTFGFPTANICLGDYLRPKFGVYAVRAGKPGEALTVRGIANIGARPTFGEHSENLEAFLFDFDQDIYGQKWEFALTHFVRPERKFDSPEALKTQIEKDVATVRKLSFGLR